MSIRKVVAGLLITAGIAIMAVPFFWRATGEKHRARAARAADDWFFIKVRRGARHHGNHAHPAQAGFALGAAARADAALHASTPATIFA